MINAKIFSLKIIDIFIDAFTEYFLMIRTFFFSLLIFATLKTRYSYRTDVTGQI